jgi:histidyl-tRNA synthetase
MRSANRSQAPLTLIRGESEMEKGIAIIKNMADGSQCEVPDNEVLNYLLANIK